MPAALGFVNEVPRAPLKAASLSHDTGLRAGAAANELARPASFFESAGGVALECSGRLQHHLPYAK